ncbi:hypothetical protein [Mycobacterium sp.]
MRFALLVAVLAAAALAVRSRRGAEVWHVTAGPTAGRGEGP